MGNEAKAMGFGDIAANEDKLGLQDHIRGVAKFICECATPMTLSIQGDWGSGKTSLFNLIEAELESKHKSRVIDIVRVNTWQFSVAGYQDGLVQVVVDEILQSCKSEGALKDFMNDHAALKKFLSRLWKGAYAFATNTTYEDEDDRGDPIKSANYIKDVKSQLEDVIAASRDEKHKDPDARLVVFIDDLDRLDPACAVGLMEGIKNFLDCQSCVFVLAIDEKVVFEGVKQKYGEELGEERKQMFFDKLIQVPFDIPVSSYDIDEFVRSLLSEGEEPKADEYRRVLEAFAKDSNPRAIKRCFNLAHLHREILGNSGGEEHSFAMLLAAVIVKMESPRSLSVLAAHYRGGVLDVKQLGSELDAIDSGPGRRKIDYEKISELLDAGADEIAAKSSREDDFKYWVCELEKTAAHNAAPAYARVVSLLNQFDFDVRKAPDGIEEYWRDDKKVVRLNDRGESVTLTIYKDALQDSGQWGDLMKSDRWRGGNNPRSGHATCVMKAGEELGQIETQLEEYLDKVFGC